MRQLAVPQDRAEYVIEVVGDAARQRADGFHFLRLPQLRLQLLLVDLRLLLRGHIDRRADEPDRLARRVAQTTAARMQPMPFAVGVADAIFALDSGA